MGGLFSSLKNFVYSKIHQCYQSIANSIIGIKDSIKNKIINKRNAVIENIINKKDAIYSACLNNKNQIVNGFKRRRNAIVNAIKTRYNRIKDAILFIYLSIISFWCNLVLSIQNKILNIINKIINTKNSIVGAIYKTKDYIIIKYYNGKNSLKYKYYSIRNAKLTKWQKVKYGFLLFIITIILLICFLTLFDIYLEEYDQAEKRLQNIYTFICNVTTYTAYYIKIGSIYLYKGSIYAAENAWIGLNYFFIHVSHYLNVFKTFVHENSKIAILAVANVLRFVFSAIWNGLVLAGFYITTVLAYIVQQICVGGYMAGEHAIYYSAIGLNHGKHGAKIAALKSWEWSKIAFSNLKFGASYAYHHGSIIGKDIMLGVGRYSIYFLTNTRTATAEGVVKIWHGSQMAFRYTIQGASMMYVFTCNSIKWLIYNTYTIIYDVIVWSYYAFWEAKSIVSEMSNLSLQKFKNFVSNSYVFLIEFSSQTYRCILDLASLVFSKINSLCVYIKDSLYYFKDCFVSFSILTVNKLYYFVSEFVVPFLLSICHALVSCLVFLQEILTKFFTDLIVYVSKFIFVTANRIYSIFYYIVNFIYYFISMIFGSFKFILVNAEIFVKSLFTLIIYLLQIIISIYLRILEGYTNHQGKIYICFLTFFTMYYSNLFTDDTNSDNAEIQETKPVINKEFEALKCFIEGLNMKVGKEGVTLTENQEDAGNLRLTGMIMPSYDDDSSDEDLFNDENSDLDIDT